MVTHLHTNQAQPTPAQADLAAHASMPAVAGSMHSTLGTTVTTQPVATASPVLASAAIAPAASLTSNALAPAAKGNAAQSPARGPQAPLSADQRDMQDALLELQVAAESMVIALEPWAWREDLNPCSRGLPQWPFVLCSPEDDVIGLQFDIAASISGDSPSAALWVQGCHCRSG